MKFLILFALIGVISAHHHYHKKTGAEIKAAREECWKDLPAEQIEAIKKYEYADEESIHNYIKCTGLKLDVWCEHEGFHKDDLLVQFGDEAAPVLEKCLAKKTDDQNAGQWAYVQWKCMVENGLKTHLKKLE